MNETKLKEFLVSSDSVRLITTKSEDHDKTVFNILKILTKNYKKTGVHVSLNHSIEHCRTRYTNNKLDQTKLILVGCGGEMSKKGKNNFAVSDAASLTDMFLILKEIASENKCGFIVIDSLSTLLLYNDEKNVERFIHYLIQYVRRIKKKLVITSVNDERTQKIRPLICQYVDKSLEIK